MPVDKSKINQVVQDLDKLPANKRLAALCSSVDEEVEKLRRELTQEAIENAKNTHDNIYSIPCSCGKAMHFVEKRKKKFYM